jgi:PRTRC genetic system protein D
MNARQYPLPDTPCVAGFDIGYRNSKIQAAVNVTAAPETLIFASVAPIETHEFELTSLRPQDVKKVKPKGAENQLASYLVGPDAIQSVAPNEFSRSVDDAFTEGDTYKALFNGGLSYMRSKLGLPEQIDVLVLGLPVRIWMMPDRKKRLVEYAVGEHSLADGQRVQINNVTVLPQPYGAYSDVTDETMANQRVLIIDGGEFTSDWLMIESGKPVGVRSGSISDAGRFNYLSAILQAISSERNNPLQMKWMFEIDNALRNHDPAQRFITIAGERIHVAEEKYNVAARKKVSDVLRQIENHVHGLDDVDQVVLAGGNPDVYAETMKLLPAFQRFKPIIPADPVLANVRGFYEYGRAIVYVA